MAAGAGRWVRAGLRRYGGAVASPNFRAGVVIVVRHPDLQRILLFERSDAAGSWQLPQGGLELGETPLEAAWRELFEETGLGPAHVAARAEYPDWVAYEWPLEVQAAHEGKRLGQVQRWFMFDALHDDVEPSPDGSEFTAWQWVDPTWAIGHVPDWRRGAYERVLGTL
ncbi:MAG: putative hydrolase [Ilumatobacteraceae bacterium]|jgi:putative (di)nucleoside polyphosphate hydrolase|nr:putative hydrolase [Ilumatobacteraceae bacterium]